MRRGLKGIAFLNERKISFEDHRLTRQDEVDACKARHGVAVTPQIFSDQQRIGGYTDLAALVVVDAVGLAIPMHRFFLCLAVIGLSMHCGSRFHFRA